MLTLFFVDLYLRLPSLSYGKDGNTPAALQMSHIIISIVNLICTHFVTMPLGGVHALPSICHYIFLGGRLAWQAMPMGLYGFFKIALRDLFVTQSHVHESLNFMTFQ